MILSVDELRHEVENGGIEDVIVALPDLLGRLQGSRLDASYFLDEVVESGFGACTYLLATDVDMNTNTGYVVDPYATGFGDLTLWPDLATLRRLPWDEGAALVLADPHTASGEPVAVAPRHVLKAQLERLAACNLRAVAGTELEFLIFDETYQQGHERGYHDLRPATRHNVDYSLQGLGGVQPVVRRIRRAMADAGLRVESARGECHPGQYEMVFRYDDALTTCDNHALYKTGGKQIAEQEGVALTFMAKYDQGEGNSCHIHLSLRDRDTDSPLFAANEPSDRAGMSPLMAHFVAGQLAYLPDFTLMYAPNPNSYKRLQPGSFAPTNITWGYDNRTCAVRVAGSGRSLRIEHRVPGGDTNPYLAVAAIIAAGLNGIDQQIPLPHATAGNALQNPTQRLPATLPEALERWESSRAASKAFGEDTVAHYAQAARSEITTFHAAVTDWERRRYFERI